MFFFEGMPATNHLPQPDIGALYSDHHGWLQGWLRRRLGNAGDAADLAQDTFMRVLSKHEAPDVLAPRAYLSTIARGLVADFFRRQDLERTYLDTLAALPEQHTPSPEARALILEALTAIDAILDGMKPAMRQAFLLSQLEGLTYPAIAERLGVSLRTVNTYMADAIAHCHRVAPGMDAVRGMMQAIPPHISAPVLQAPLKGRRQALRGLALLASGGAVGYAVYGSADDAAPWRAALAEYRTGIGEQRSVRLADGSLLILNTDSAVDVRFDAGQRTVLLRSGEIVIETAHRSHAGAPPDTRPFVVQTAHGAMRALGTRFTVRHVPESTTLVVLEHAVAVRPARASLQTPPVLVRAGQQLVFNAAGTAPLQTGDDLADAWRHGSIVVDNWPLSRLVAELGRYRSGHLACDTAVASLRVSGAFPVADTDQALAVLARSLPVRVRRLTRYWVTVGAA